jgi:CRP-like cAMP-binding protein
MALETQISANKILASLPKQEAGRLGPYFEIVSLPCNDVLYHEDQPIHYVYFPTTAMLSLLSALDNGSIVEIAPIGSEGMLGVRSLLGSDKSDSTAAVQIAGECLRVRADILANEFERHGELHRQLLRYLRYMVTLISQSVACNRVHLLQQRFCRWLLALYGRVLSNEFPMTHETISQRLGTPRSEVSVNAKVLQDRGLIRYHRGKMTITDAQGLEPLACECHRVVKAEMEKLIADLDPERPSAARAPGCSDLERIRA